MVKNSTKWSFLEPFLNTNEEIHLNEVSRRLKKPHTIVRRYLIDFENQGVLKKEVRGRQSFYSLNKDNPVLINVLVIVEKEKLINHSKNSLLREFVQIIQQKIDLACLIFGSFADKNINKANDIDLLLIGKTNQKNLDDIKEIEKIINKKIHLINVKNLNEINDSLKKEILSKHLIIKALLPFLN